MPGGMIVGTLSKIEIDKHFREDLPYRTGVLLAHYKMTRQPWTAERGPTAWLNACFIASLIVGRTYLNMLGIGKSPDDLEKVGKHTCRNDDVCVQHLGGTLVDISKLTAEEHKLLRGFIKMADKAGAHFTRRGDHALDRTHEAIMWIHAHLKANLYEPTDRSGLEPLVCESDDGS